MKFTIAATVAMLLTTTAIAAPTDGGATYASYGSYPWVNGAPVNEQDASKDDPKTPNLPSHVVYTSTYSVVALGSEVRNGTVSVPGPSNAIGYFNYGINSHEDTICYVSTYISQIHTLHRILSNLQMKIEHHPTQRSRNLSITRQNRNSYSRSRPRCIRTSSSCTPESGR